MREKEKSFIDASQILRNEVHCCLGFDVLLVSLASLSFIHRDLCPGVTMDARDQTQEVSKFSPAEGICFHIVSQVVKSFSNFKTSTQRSC